MDIDNRAPRSVQELEQMAHALAQEIFHKVLKDRTLCASVTGVDDVQWMRGDCYVESNPQKPWQARAELVIETLKKWGMRFLPGAIVQLKDEVHARHRQGLLTQEQRECARKAFERGLDPNVGFDAHNFVWDNLRAAVGRPFPPRSN